MLKVKISYKLIQELLTIGKVYSGTYEITEGLPENCGELISVSTKQDNGRRAFTDDAIESESFVTLMFDDFQAAVSEVDIRVNNHSQPEGKTDGHR